VSRQSTSFSDEEIHLLDEMFRILIRGGDARRLVRNRAFANVMRKVSAMKERAKALKPQSTSILPPPLPDDADQDYDPDYSEGNQLGALNPGEMADDGG
jgi:hypothetical protein